MRAFRRREQNRSSRPMVDGLFLAVRTLNLMSVQPKLNYIKFWPGVFYFNVMELIGSHVYRMPSHPRRQITATQKNCRFAGALIFKCRSRCATLPVVTALFGSSRTPLLPV
jgi:hypothetical protein